MSAVKRSLQSIRSLATAVEHPVSQPGNAAAFKAKSRRAELGAVRSNWLRHEIQEIFDGPLMETVFKAVSGHSYVARMKDEPGSVVFGREIRNSEHPLRKTSALYCVDIKFFLRPATDQ
jgi:hypothetical protein